MSNQVNLNPNYNIAQTPMQGDINAEKVLQSSKDAVNNSYVANRVNASEESPWKIPLTVGIGVGLGQYMDRFNKKCVGEYKDTPYGKIGAFFDRWEESAKNGKLANTNFGKKVTKGVGNFSKWIDRVTDKNKLTYALKHTSASPENSWAKFMWKGLRGWFIQDAASNFDDFLKVPDNVIKMEQYGKDANYINALSDKIKNLSKNEQIFEIQKAELVDVFNVKPEIVDKVYGKTKDRIYNKMIAEGKSARGAAKESEKAATEAVRKLAETRKVRAIGFKNVKEYKRLKSDMLKNQAEFFENVEKSVAKKNNWNISIWRKNGQKIYSKLLGRKVGFDELCNKNRVTLHQGAKGALGKFFTNAHGYFVEGMTNRFAGGKISTLMQAYIFADMVISTAKTPRGNGEKRKTFIERFINDYVYFLALPLGIKLMYRVGGMKWAGLDKAGVEAYLKKLETFNAKAGAGQFANKQEYKAARKELKKILNAGVKNPITKLFKKAASILEVGNNKVMYYKSGQKMNANILRKMKYNVKNAAGYPIRLLIPMFILSPFFAKIGTKIGHKIFGRPTKSVLDKEETENKQQPQQSEQSNMPTSLLDRYKQQQEQAKSQAQTSAQSQAQTSATPQQEQVQTQEQARIQAPAQKTGMVRATQQEPVRTYVPSSAGIILPPDNGIDSVQKALDNAKATEESINRLLGQK